MKLALPRRKNSSSRQSWHGTAVIFEALGLLFFLIIFMTVLVQLFGISHSQSSDAHRLSNAIILASNEAERFSADPTAETETLLFNANDNTLQSVDFSSENTYKVVCTIQPESKPAGTLYRATIQVILHDAVLYEITSASYISFEKEAQ